MLKLKKKTNWQRTAIIAAMTLAILIFTGPWIARAAINTVNNVNTFIADSWVTLTGSYNNHWRQAAHINGQSTTIEEQALIIKELKAENQLLKNTFQDNIRLESLLKLKSKQFPRSTPARIILRSPQLWDQEIILNKGQRDNIKPGMALITERGILGQIQIVKKDYCIAKLLASQELKLGAEVLRNGAKGILYPSSEVGKAYLRYIPIGSDIQIGDTIQTANMPLHNLKRIFPPKYSLGTVSQISSDPNGAEMNVLVDLLEDGSQAEYLLILH